MKKFINKKFLKDIINNSIYYSYAFASLIASLIYFILMRKKIEKIFFWTDSNMIKVFNLVNIICIIILALLIFTLLYFIKNRKKYKIFLKHFLIYFGIMLIFLFILWPGIYKGDEYYVLKAVHRFTLDYKQHYFTSLFYLISLNIIPTIGGITFFQILIISIIVSYVLGNIEKNLKHKKLVYLMYIPLLVPSVIDNNLFTLRSSLISYLFLLFVFELILFKLDNNKKRLIVSFVLVLIISSWKSEFIYLPILFLIYLILFYRKQLSKLLLFCSSILFIVFYLFLKLPQNGETSIKGYVYTAVLNPLSILVQYDDIESTISKNDKAALEKLVDFETLRDYPCYYNTPIYFSGLINKDLNTKDKIKFFNAYFHLVINNFSRFMQERLYVYYFTNFGIGSRPNHTGWEEPTSQWTLEHNHYDIINTTFGNFNGPFGVNFKKRVICALLLRNYDTYEPLFLNQYFYNVTPSILLCLLLMIVLIRKKMYKELFIQFIILCQFPLIFLTAPANFWMYYVVLYIVLNFTFVYYSIMYIDFRGKKLWKK